MPSQHQSETPIPKCKVPKIQPRPQTIPTLFTSTPVSSRFRTPIFQSKDSQKDLDQCVNSAAVINDTVSASNQALQDQTEVVPKNNPSEIPPDSPLQAIALSPVKTPPSNQKTSVAGPDDFDEEDQSIFYTPELFEEECEESTTATIEENKGSSTASTEQTSGRIEQPVFSIEKTADRHPKELLRSEKGQIRTCAGTSDVKGAGVIPEKECISPNIDCVLSEGIAEQAVLSCSIDSDDRATQQQHNSSSKSRRLSRSRQKALSREAGKLTTSRGSQPQVIVIND